MRHANKTTVKALQLYPRRFVILKVSRSFVKTIYVSGLGANAATLATHSALGGTKLIVSRKKAKILTVNRKSHKLTDTLFKGGSVIIGN